MTGESPEKGSTQMQLDERGVEVCLWIRDGEPDSAIAKRLGVSVSKLRLWRKLNGIRRVNGPSRGPDDETTKRIGRLWQERADDLLKDQAKSLIIKTRYLRHVSVLKEMAMCKQMQAMELQQELEVRQQELEKIQAELKRARIRRLASIIIRWVPFGRLFETIKDLASPDYANDVTQMLYDFGALAKDTIAVSQEMTLPSSKTTVKFLGSAVRFYLGLSKLSKKHGLEVAPESFSFFPENNLEQLSKLTFEGLLKLNRQLDRLIKASEVP